MGDRRLALAAFLGAAAANAWMPRDAFIGLYAGIVVMIVILHRRFRAPA